MDPASALLVMAGTRVAAAGFKISAADEKINSLELTKEQGVLAHQQKTLANFETMQKVLDSQVAQATTRGIGLGSSSLEAIQRNTVNVAAKNQSNLDVEEDIFKRNVENEKSNVKSTLYAELFGDVSTVASDFATAGAKMPSKV